MPNLLCERVAEAWLGELQDAPGKGRLEVTVQVGADEFKKQLGCCTLPLPGRTFGCVAFWESEPQMVGFLLASLKKTVPAKTRRGPFPVSATRSHLPSLQETPGLLSTAAPRKDRYGCGGQNRFGIPFWLLGEFTTHSRTYFSGWIESDVHWGCDLGFDPRGFCSEGNDRGVLGMNRVGDSLERKP